MDAPDALLVASRELGTAPFTPAGAEDGERALVFTWQRFDATWVTNGSQHIVALRGDLPFAAVFGEFEPTSYAGTFEGVRVHRFLECPASRILDTFRLG